MAFGGYLNFSKQDAYLASNNALGIYSGVWASSFLLRVKEVLSHIVSTPPHLGVRIPTLNPCFTLAPSSLLVLHPNNGILTYRPLEYILLYRTTLCLITPLQPTLLTSNPCTPSSSSFVGSCTTSVSNSFITPTTTLALSTNPFTATRSMRFVVAA